jgi:tetratricopeptide (TPR) repeat protein
MERGGRRLVRGPERSFHGRTLALASCLVLAQVACGPAHTTERVIDGQAVVGPYIQPEAYAAFGEAVYLEEHGNLEGALHAYRRAQNLDPDSPGIAARIGALLCRSDLKAGLEELETSGFARNHAPAWAARARCLHTHGDPARALDAARRAVMLDPHDPEANLLVARIHRERAEPDRASAWLLGWLLSDPNASASWQAIAAEAKLAGDSSLGELARALASAAAPAESADAPPAVAAPARPLELSARAARRGEPALALEQAELSLSANPRDADALIAALYAAALLADEAALGRLLEQARAGSAPNAELAPLLADLLRFRVGDDAAERWLAAYRRLASPAP